MNYALSDIHGHLNEFNKMLELIKFNPENDHLYILGDCVDKGKNSIELLLKVMDMVEEGSATYLLGNHDHMMFDFLRQIREDIPSTYQPRIWFLNSGDVTLRQFAKLDIETQNRVYEFIKNLPIVIPSVKVGDKEFYMVHSFPHPEVNEIITMKDTGYDLNDVMNYIWERVFEYENDNSNKYILAGHTIGEGININTYINLDCGCACDFRLGCLRLEDFEIYYVDCEDQENNNISA